VLQAENSLPQSTPFVVFRYRRIATVALSNVKKPSLSGTDCPEKKLLVCCARRKLQPGLVDAVRELAAGPLDWDFLLAEAAENSTTPLLAHHLLDGARDEIEAAKAKALREAARATTVRCLALNAQLIRLMKAFRARGILAIPYKGPVLAAQAYGDVTLREFGDLDIVLRHRDIAKANEILVGLGFRPRFPWTVSPVGISSIVPGEYNYQDESGRVVVDLHTDRTLRHFPRRPDLDELAARLVPVDVSGHSVFTFALEDQLPILCIHGAKDFWQRIIWIVDIAELIHSQAQLDWDGVMRRAEALKAQRMLRLGLALAVGLLEAPLPNEIRVQLQGDQLATSIASELVQMHLSRRAASRGAAGRFQFRRRMLEGRLAGLRYSLRLAVAPAEEDWSMMHLPRPLAPLYVALRPLRLLSKYGVSNGVLP
jgi:Uncharacterised nucleotidyltransferase